MGRLRTKALVVVVMLKMLPAVPVETLLIMLADKMPLTAVEESVPPEIVEPLIVPDTLRFPVLLTLK